MSTTMGITLEWKNSFPADDEQQEYIKGIVDYYVDTWKNAKDVVTKDFSDGFKLIGDDIVKQFKSVGDGIKGTAKDAITGTFSAAVRGEMDSVEDIWSDSWDKMVSSVDGMFDKLFNGLIGRIKDIGTNIGYDLFAKPGTDWFMNATGLGPLIEYAGDAIPDIITGLLHGGIAKTANTAMLGNAINNISTTLGNLYFGGTEYEVGAGMSGIGEGIGASAANSAAGSLSGGVTSIGADFSGINADIFSNTASSFGADFAGINADIFSNTASSFGADFAGINSDIGMSALGNGGSILNGTAGLTGGLAVGGGMLAGLEGVSALMGMPGPTEAMFGAVSSIFGGGGGHTKESAH